MCENPSGAPRNAVESLTMPEKLSLWHARLNKTQRKERSKAISDGTKEAFVSGANRGRKVNSLTAREMSLMADPAKRLENLKAVQEKTRDRRVKQCRKWSKARSRKNLKRAMRILLAAAILKGVSDGLENNR
jgi:hypothetical protein